MESASAHNRLIVMMMVMVVVVIVVMMIVVVVVMMVMVMIVVMVIFSHDHGLFFRLGSIAAALVLGAQNLLSIRNRLQQLRK